MGTVSLIDGHFDDDMNYIGVLPKNSENFYRNENICVSCGKSMPEGNMVCNECLTKVKEGE